MHIRIELILIVIGVLHTDGQIGHSEILANSRENLNRENRDILFPCRDIGFHAVDKFDISG